MTTLRTDLPQLKKINVFYKRPQIDRTTRDSPGLWKAETLMNLIAPDDHANMRDDFEQVAISDLLEIHTREYVEAVLDFEIPNGHMNKKAATLEAILWQNGSFLAAVEHAVKNNTVAFSPTSGFHHAGAKYGGGFCTFNALMIAAKKYIREHDRQVLILDGDAHWGDGCIDCNVNGVRYVSTSRVTPNEFIDTAMNYLSVHRGLVLYQAGADCHQDDVFGAGNYTLRQMSQRDLTIFGACKARNLPIVWNLAGGYGCPDISDTIRAHYQTWDAAKIIYCLNDSPAPALT